MIEVAAYRLIPDDRDASSIATQIMDTARIAGMNDNATVVVAASLASSC